MKKQRLTHPLHKSHLSHQSDAPPTPAAQESGPGTDEDRPQATWDGQQWIGASEAPIFPTWFV